MTALPATSPCRYRPFAGYRSDYRESARRSGMVKLQPNVAGNPAETFGNKSPFAGNLRQHTEAKRKKRPPILLPSDACGKGLHHAKQTSGARPVLHGRHSSRSCAAGRFCRAARRATADRCHASWPGPGSPEPRLAGSRSLARTGRHGTARKASARIAWAHRRNSCSPPGLPHSRPASVYAANSSMPGATIPAHCRQCWRRPGPIMASVALARKADQGPRDPFAFQERLADDVTTRAAAAAKLKDAISALRTKLTPEQLEILASAEPPHGPPPGPWGHPPDAAGPGGLPGHDRHAPNALPRTDEQL